MPGLLFGGALGPWNPRMTAVGDHDNALRHDLDGGHVPAVWYGQGVEGIPMIDERAPVGHARRAAGGMIGPLGAGEAFVEEGGSGLRVKKSHLVF